MLGTPSARQIPQPIATAIDSSRMPRIPKLVTVRLSSIDQRRYSEAAAREGLSIAAWLKAAAELALARGATR